MLLDNEFFAVFESDKSQWPFSVLNIVNICDRISQASSGEEIPSLPQEYLRSLYKVARCYELEGKLETLGSGGAMDHSPKIGPALEYIKHFEDQVKIQEYQFSLDDFIGELKNILEELIRSLSSYKGGDIICIEYYLRSHLLRSESSMTIYSISALREYGDYLSEKAKVHQSKKRINSARRCLEMAKELESVSPEAVLKQNTHIAYGNHFQLTEPHRSLNNIWPVRGNEELWPVSSNESEINEAILSVVESYKPQIFGSWCSEEFKFLVSGYNDSRELLCDSQCISYLSKT